MYTLQTDSHGNRIVCRGDTVRSGYQIVAQGTYATMTEYTTKDVTPSKEPSKEDKRNLRYLSPLVGGIIRSVAIDECPEGKMETTYGLLIEINGVLVTAMILMDPEGNGPGHLDIRPA